MTDPTLDDVPETHETATPDRREHAKAPAHLDDDALAERADEERAETGADAPAGVDGPQGDE